MTLLRIYLEEATRGVHKDKGVDNSIIHNDEKYQKQPSVQQLRIAHNKELLYSPLKSCCRRKINYREKYLQEIRERSKNQNHIYNMIPGL